MVGLDFSSASLEQARRLASSTGANIDFVEADVYDAAQPCWERAASICCTPASAALCWLPDIDRWAAAVAELLAPGGRLFIREGHPMLWSLDEKHQDQLVVDYPYFQREEPLVESDGGTYVQTDAVFQQTTTHSWNHGLGEVVTALIASGLQITGLAEHDSVPWDALPGQMELLETGEFRLADRPWRLAHSYTLQAVSRAVSPGSQAR